MLRPSAIRGHCRRSDHASPRPSRGRRPGAEYCGFDRNRSTNGSMMRLTVRGQRAAVVAAEHLDAGADRPPRRVDHRPAWVAADCDGQLRIRAHQHRIGALREPAAENLGSVAGRRLHPGRMNKLLMLRRPDQVRAASGRPGTAPSGSAPCVRSERRFSSRWSPSPGRRSSASWRVAATISTCRCCAPAWSFWLRSIPLRARSFHCPTMCLRCTRGGWPRCER